MALQNNFMESESTLRDITKQRQHEMQVIMEL